MGDLEAAEAEERRIGVLAVVELQRQQLVLEEALTGLGPFVSPRHPSDLPRG